MARIRTRTSTENLQGQYIQYANANTIGSLWSSSRKTVDLAIAESIKQLSARPVVKQDAVFTINETISDSTTPGYFKARAEGKLLPTNPMTSTKVYSGSRPLSIATWAECRVASDATTYCSVRYNSVRLPALRQVGSYSDLANQAAVRAKANLHSKGMDLLTTASEAHKALAMLIGLRRSLMQAVTTVSGQARLIAKGKNGSPLTLWKEFSRLWLEGRFGWRILYYDIRNIIDYMENMNNAKRHTFGTGTGSQTYRSNTTYTTRETKVDVKVGYAAILDPSIPGYMNIPNTAWELVPFSLVLDWFFGIQNWILAFTQAPANVRPVPSSSYQVVTITNSVSAQAKVELSPGFFLSAQGEQGVYLGYDNVSKIRTVAGNPVISFPSLSGPKGYQWLDLATLMIPLYGALKTNSKSIKGFAQYGFN